MELKVWVDGIQRVVCGVTEATTCNEVVRVLTHATGQNGGFSLIEKWRNTERLLAPNEQPLKALMKYGEYANNVHFLMRRLGSDNKQVPVTAQAPSNKRHHDFLHSFSPTNNNNVNKTPVISNINNKEIKKSLTFSGGHGSSGGSVSSENSLPPVNSDSSLRHPENAMNRNVKNQRDARSKQEIPKGVVRGVPQKPPRNSESPNPPKIERPKYPPSYDEAVSRSSGRFPTSHLSIASSHVQDEESPSSKRPHLSSRTDQYSPGTNLQHINSHKSHQSMEASRDLNLRNPVSTEHLNLSPNMAKLPGNSSPSRAKSPEKPIHNISDDTLKAKRTLPVKIDVDKLDGKNAPKKPCAQFDESSRDPQYQDLLRLVSLQREKLDNQQAEITQFDAEIVYWENKLQEQEEKLSLLQEEACQLERTHHEQEGELLQLDRRSFHEEVEIGRQEERTLRSELTLARSKMANCETELLQCRQRIRLLLEDLGEERRLRSLRDEQQEGELRDQLGSLQTQLEEQTQDREGQKNSTEEAKEELLDLESRLADKHKEMEKLMEEIREANLLSLSLVPSEEGKILAEGNFCNRPGSTRKIIGSPRQLENAVPTNKNPHGVWV